MAKKTELNEGDVVYMKASSGMPGDKELVAVLTLALDWFGIRKPNRYDRRQTWYGVRKQIEEARAKHKEQT